jgi:hypothetical protein
MPSSEPAWFVVIYTESITIQPLWNTQTLGDRHLEA